MYDRQGVHPPPKMVPTAPPPAKHEKKPSSPPYQTKAKMFWVPPFPFFCIFPGPCRK